MCGQDEYFWFGAFPVHHPLSGDSGILINDRVGPDDEFEPIMKPGSCKMVDSFHSKNWNRHLRTFVGSIT